MDIFCINLKKDTKKWNNIKSQAALHNLQIQRYDAVSGKDYMKKHKISQDVITQPMQSYLSKGGIGCFLSHYSLWQKQITENKKIISSLRYQIITLYHLFGKR